MENGNNITVEVEARYIEGQSEPDNERYVFSYTITIRNEGDVSAQLLTRHWVITDANGNIQEVKGEGVVGEQPHLKPGEGFQYTSGAMIATPVGSMRGTCQILTDGISRLVKFQHLFTGILGREAQDGELDRVPDQFAQAAKARLLECAQAPRLLEVSEAVAKTGPVYVVSGGMQDELRDVFKLRGIDQHFAVIYGSPDSKAEIFTRERAAGAMPDPLAFVGDARCDHETAKQFGLDFIFASDWTDVVGWSDYVADQGIRTIGAIDELLSEHNAMDKRP